MSKRIVCQNGDRFAYPHQMPVQFLLLRSQISPVRYTCQPTGTSCLSSRRPPTLPASPTQSPTKATGTGSSAFPGSRRGSRKHVQFPDFDEPSLKSADLLHANWKQGSSPPSDQSIVPGKYILVRVYRVSNSHM